MIPGTVLGHYRILGPLGKGGMGEVYLAEDTKLNRRVALKLLPAALAADPERRRRLEREAQTVAALNHPNIVTIYSVEGDATTPFLTMEFVEGEALREHILQGGMAIETLLRTVLAISDAVAAAHQRGIVHRDLNPANVMVAADGRVKVLDFGLAKLHEAEGADGGEASTQTVRADLTGEGQIVGTVAYMSPEQAEGKPVDPRSDVFSLGIMIYEMASGERPFKGDTHISVISAIIKDTPASISDVRPELPGALARIVRRCLMKDPVLRYQTARDLHNDLNELQQETNGRGTSVVRPVAHNGRKTLTWIAVALGGLVVTGASLFVLGHARSPSSGAPAGFGIDRMVRLTTTGTASMAAISPDGRYVVHVKMENGKPSLWVRQTATSSDVRIVPSADVGFDGVAFSPDGNYVYYNTHPEAGGIPSLYKVAALGGAPIRVLPEVNSAVSFSPDQRQMAYMRNSIARSTTELMVAGADGGNARAFATATAPDQFQATRPAWSPDGRTILASATSTRPGSPFVLYAIDAKSGTTRTIGDPWAVIEDVQWLPDGGSFLITAVDFTGISTFQVFHVTYPAGERSRVTNDLNAYVGVSISADGHSVATVQSEYAGGIYVVDASAREPKRITSGSGREEGTLGITWLPDGRIVYTSTASGIPQLWIADADGTNERQLTSLRGPAIFPSSAPDGRWVYFTCFAQEGTALYRVAPDGAGLQQLTNDGDARGPVVSRDGRTLYFTALKTGNPLLMKVSADGGTAVRVPGAGAYFQAIGVSPDGARLLGIAWSEKLRRTLPATYALNDESIDIFPDLPTDLRFTPDGGFVGVQRIQGTAVLTKWRAGGVRPVALAPPAQEMVTLGAVSPVGRVAIARGQETSDVVLIKVK